MHNCLTDNMQTLAVDGLVYLLVYHVCISSNRQAHTNYAKLVKQVLLIDLFVNCMLMLLGSCNPLSIILLSIHIFNVVSNHYTSIHICSNHEKVITCLHNTRYVSIIASHFTRSKLFCFCILLFCGCSGWLRFAAFLPFLLTQILRLAVSTTWQNDNYCL